MKRGGDFYHIPLSFSLWPVWKTDGSWKMTVGFHKLDQMVITIALSNVVLLLEQVNISPGIWYGAIDLADVLCSIPVGNNHEK